MNREQISKTTSTETKYQASQIELKWQQKWLASKVFATSEHSTQKKYYVLEMFPYPSGNIHMGHIRNYAIGDVVARFKKAQGYNVLHPMGWDSFGLPAENAAKEYNLHPKKWTYQNISTMREELKSFGFSWDWSREIITSEPSYYHCEQAIFLKLYEAGLAYKKETLVNWDPIDNCVLANEQVIDGKGWRSGALVVQKELSQWFLRITDFADELLEGLDTLQDWPHQVLTMQKNWIRRSKGATITFTLENPNSLPPSSKTYQTLTSTIEVFTTKPHTIYGASFIALAKEHPLVQLLTEESSDLQQFIAELARDELTHKHLGEKKWFHLNLEASHPLLKGVSLPLLVANFVLPNYGSGAVLGVPAHDQRDYEFAELLALPIKQVINPAPNAAPEDLTQQAYEGEGLMINSGPLNGLPSQEAVALAIELLQSKGVGKPSTQYLLKDWGISRQRYWGTPIPIVYCPKCGAVPEKLSNLPITLPEDVDLSTATGNPLDTHPTWKHVNCPQCSEPATRETDTFDTFVESSWYFLKYATPKSEGLKAEAIDKWLPVDHYIGGIEHAIMHLLYARFFTRALNKLGIVHNLKEPFKRLTTQGMVCHKTYQCAGTWVFPTDVLIDASGQLTHKTTGQPVVEGPLEKMSKSKKNVVTPNLIKESYGVDTARMFVLSDAPPTKDLEWNIQGVEGTWRFLNRLWHLAQYLKDAQKAGTCLSSNHIHLQEPNKVVLDELGQDDATLVQLTHETIKNVTECLEKTMLNKAIALIRELYNSIWLNHKKGSTLYTPYAFKVIVQLLNPFAPHLTEELWQALSFSDNMLAEEAWPTYEEKYAVRSKVVVAVQINGKTRGKLMLSPTALEADVIAQIQKEPTLVKFINGTTIRKVIYVPAKIINIVL